MTTHALRTNMIAAIAIAGLIGLAMPAAAAEDSCWSRDADGKCLDNFALPATGQYSTADDYSGEAPIPAGIDGTNQPHGVVRLKQSTYIYAHDICRFVDNGTTRGPGLFIGLRSRAEWAGVALEGRNPAGSAIVRCCRPVTVEICGSNKSISFTKQGDAVTFTGGHDRMVTYTCAYGTAGQAPTYDTSWIQQASGQCQAPASGGDSCHLSKGGEKRGENCDDDGNGSDGRDNEKGPGSGESGKEGSGKAGTGGKGTGW